MINIIRKAVTMYGAIAATEMIGLYRAIAQNGCFITKGIGVDLGSHAGRSSIIAVNALNQFSPFFDKFYMVDPLYDFQNADWTDTYQKTPDKVPWGYSRDTHFLSNVFIDVSSRTHIPVEMYGGSSRQFFKKLPVDSKINYVFIDSDDHDEKLVQFEIDNLQHLLNPGALIFFHDFNGPIQGPKNVYDRMLSSGKYTPIEFDWQTSYNIYEAYKKELPKDENNWHMKHQQYNNYIGGLIKK